jgi:hypothetical protein
LTVLCSVSKKHRVESGEKERVAYHESGHTLVALSVEHADPVHRVSIIPRTIGALGYTLQLPTEERYLMTKPEIEDQLAVMLGGRVAEEIIYKGVISTGAVDDLERASELARQMVTRFGMSSKLGHLTYGKPLTSRFLAPTFVPEERNYSEKTAETIDEEVRRIVDESYARVSEILTRRREELERIAPRWSVRKRLIVKSRRCSGLARIRGGCGRCCMTAPDQIRRRKVNVGHRRAGSFGIRLAAAPRLKACSASRIYVSRALQVFQSEADLSYDSPRGFASLALRVDVYYVAVCRCRQGRDRIAQPILVPNCEPVTKSDGLRCGA